MTDIAAVLRRLYFVRFGFAAVWAVLLFATVSEIAVNRVAFASPYNWFALP